MTGSDAKSNAGSRSRRSVMARIKIVTVAVVAVLVLIIVLQNTETVDTQLLFFSITMPRAASLFGTLLIGFILGVVSPYRLSKR